ncbi:hypothetical protein [Cognatishimia maritima]|uniref:Uncharacterized protein n=1 Tax=Cognatishimia maritima TaxID=870908 RepID=A0A1M5JWA4_9RHOB|nr:hypothetical protein [Cognatishimia maritima]SHG44851.1 hypothetical protein SAMN04488044_0802 [Cognatishimia maritima]
MVFDKEIEQFGSEIVRNAVEQGMQEALNHIRYNTGKAASAHVEKAIGIAARSAMRAFFSNHELIGSFSISLRTENGDTFDLAEEFGAPLIVAFDEDGWLEN